MSRMLEAELESQLRRATRQVQSLNGLRNDILTRIKQDHDRLGSLNEEIRQAQVERNRIFHALHAERQLHRSR